MNRCIALLALALTFTPVVAETLTPAIATPEAVTPTPAATTLQAVASPAANLTVDAAKLRAVLKQMAPDMAATSIQPTPVPGLYEVLFGAELLYFSADGRYMIDGNLIDLVSRENLSERPKNLMRKQLVDSLTAQDFVVFPAQGKVKHTVTVFTDIDCGYCRKLHGEIKEINELGISVRYAFFPRTGKNSDSYRKAVAVWCAADRLDAMTKSKNGAEVELKSCTNPVDKHMDLVAKLGITGTPAIITAEGRLLPGYVPAKKLAGMLDKPTTIPQP